MFHQWSWVMSWSRYRIPRLRKDLSLWNSRLPKVRGDLRWRRWRMYSRMSALFWMRNRMTRMRCELSLVGHRWRSYGQVLEQMHSMSWWMLGLHDIVRGLLAHRSGVCGNEGI